MGTAPGFDDCYHACYGRLAAQLNAYLGDAAAAEDVVQEAFLRAWQHWHRISAYEDPVAWIRRVAWNLATSHWRRVVRDAKLALGGRTPRIRDVHNASFAVTQELTVSDSESAGYALHRARLLAKACSDFYNAGKQFRLRIVTEDFAGEESFIVKEGGQSWVLVREAHVPMEIGFSHGESLDYMVSVARKALAKALALTR